MWRGYGCGFFGYGPNFIGRGGFDLFPYWYIMVGIKVVVGLIVLFAAIYVAKLLINKTYTRNISGKALEILNERYAKGEIEEQEYINKKKKILGY
ncbi:MAG: SHOCT domain-containing protein [Thermovenabulum sp.]|uniref:SHOCT domain-containing protein n=1 Tax=Thermovenabulum sp. TaxID=3100335 RepID=UPI003C7CA8FC